MAIETLFRLAVLTGEPPHEATALKALRPMGDLMAKHPSGFGRFLCALDFHLGPVTEIALVAPKAGDGLGLLEAEVFSRYLPNRVVTGMVAGDAGAAAGIPLLQGREAVGGKPTGDSVTTGTVTSTKISVHVEAKGKGIDFSVNVKLPTKGQAPYPVLINVGITNAPAADAIGRVMARAAMRVL